MLSYRHGYHAGNHADVLKHIVLIQLARYMGQKDKPFTYVDTHAGRGRYALDSESAQKTGEWRDGIGRVANGTLRCSSTATRSSTVDRMRSSKT